ncbi:MAG: DNA polymerase III subunit beta [Actinomycetota bacterium]|nr:DNA polymerase III subunit beta [Actinomycetota bacterium]
MIVSCDKKTFNSCVQQAVRVLSSRVAMPILSGVLIECNEAQLVVKSTNLEMSLKAEAGAEVIEDGSSVVSGRILAEVVKNLKDENLKIETDEKYLSVKGEKGVYKIRQMKTEDFPKVAEWEGEKEISIPVKELVTTAGQISKVSATDERRPVFTGILFEKKPETGGLRAVATDSYRLAWRDLKLEEDTGSWESSIIPTRSIQEVARIASTLEENIEAKIQNRQALFKIGNVTLAVRLIEGSFPNYNQLIPKEQKTTVTVEKEALLPLIKRATIFGQKIKIDVSSNRLTVSSETPDIGDAWEEIEAEAEGEEVEIGFNGSYLIDGISGIEGEKALIEITSPEKPALVKDAEKNNYNYIIMPLRIK